MKRLIILSAPSGAGKTTLCQKLLEDFPNDLLLSISSTTRAPRGAEVHGKDYYFLSIEEFEKKIRENEFAEWAKVHGHYYGTSKIGIQKAFSHNKSILLDIDVQGAESLRKHYPHQCFSVFIAPPNLKVLEDRLRARGTESEENIQRRLKAAQTELAQKDQFHLILVNDSLDETYSKLKQQILLILRDLSHGS